MLFYSCGMGPVPFTLSAEVVPLENRMVGMSFAVFANMFGAGLVTLFVPYIDNASVILASVGGSESGGMLSVSLEELNYIFEMTTKKHREYQLKVMVPWTLRNFEELLLFRYVDPPEQCYNWARTKQEQEMQTLQVPNADGRGT
ncbi:hypothetical protein LTR36_002659 [Oleoguttula mirabilis]|uniref:Uncharacterized protein n=1 Tax=Oleoguttula mirabilis TaxID=1507867 RepID=A0AAV9JKD4_9PEZI|nr:hypothetical protein LTR36_002659 [Oleoguttula mirabilis]